MKINQWTLGLAAVGIVSFASAINAEETRMNTCQTTASSATGGGYAVMSIEWTISAPDDSNAGFCSWSSCVPITDTPPFSIEPVFASAIQSGRFHCPCDFVPEATISQKQVHTMNSLSYALAPAGMSDGTTYNLAPNATKVANRLSTASSVALPLAKSCREGRLHDLAVMNWAHQMNPHAA